MVFRSRIDPITIKVMVGCSVIAGAALFLPLLMPDSTVTQALISAAVFVLSTGILYWVKVSLGYSFQEDHLLVKGGPFRYRIAYVDIKKVSETDEYISGFRMMLAKTGLEIFYRSGLWESIKISPEEEDRFLTELKKRCPALGDT
ncbi:hypothetical protein CR205_13830 [Alteribacter lacisalsi]|uniref:Uncharacterized protein YyaB-like PH domain-containing protein n=1 Tax=Alteribacter lacisalsi TaxID=2045244 RepID=A0A2W0H4K2_9BACI|nr:PH domain-containing protein [Alteribacter lacisalsi]PYZ96763.1 hypothetical protein CR205_13830 [Alteribacter lacisalsi]